MVKLSSLDDLAAHGADTVIDVRSPAEYAEDHVPGAINLPVLDDAERAEIGTIYKQVSAFTARKRGAALVFRNAARHIETALADHPGGWRPLVYCWRGGQRSGAFSWMLREIGWRADVIEGGYKSYRRLVVKTLYDTPLPVRLISLAGYTGTAKTDLLARVACRGAQVIDLEGLACHRGSLLGEMEEPQPSQKRFETRLAAALGACDPARPVLVEAESSKIGSCLIPPTFWAAMQAAPQIEVEAPLDARARYLARAYADILADGRRLKARLAPLARVRGHALIAHWSELIDAGDRVPLCRSLAADHYDPAYRRALKAQPNREAARLALDDLSESALEAAADRLGDLVQTIATDPARPEVSRPITAAS